MFYRCPVNHVIGIYSPNIDILTPGTMVQEKDAETPCYFNGWSSMGILSLAGSAIVPLYIIWLYSYKVCA